MERRKNEHERQAFFNLFNDVSHAKDDIARAAALHKLRKIRGDAVHVSIVMSLAHAYAIGQREKYLQANTREAKRDMQLASAVAAYIGLDNSKVRNPYRSNKTTDGQTFVLDSVKSMYEMANDANKTLLDEHYDDLYGKNCTELIAQVSAPTAERHLIPIDAKKIRVAAIGSAAIGAGLLGIVAPANAAQADISLSPVSYSADSIQTIPASFSAEAFNIMPTASGELTLNPVAPPDTDNGGEINLDPVAPPDDGEDSGEMNLDPIAPPDNGEPTAPPTEQPPAPVEPTPPAPVEPPAETEPPAPVEPPAETEPPAPVEPPAETKPPVNKEKDPALRAAAALEKEGGTLNKRTAEIIRSFKKCTDVKLTNMEIAAFIGNFYGENDTLDPARNQNGGGPGRGLGQWEITARGGELIEFGGDDWDTIAEQVRFACHELDTTEKRAHNKAHEAKSIEDATVAVRIFYERPNPAKARDSVRISYAKKIYNLINDQKNDGDTADKPKDDKPEKKQETKVVGYGYNAEGVQKLHYWNQGFDNGSAPYAGGTFKNYGCAPSTLATIVSTLTDKNISNVEVGRIFNKYGAMVNGSGTNREVFKNPNFAAWDELGIEMQAIDLTDAAFKKVIDNGGMVVMRQKGGVFASSNGKDYAHFMAVTGYNNHKNTYDNVDHKFLIADSNSNTGARYTKDADGFSFSTIKGDRSRARTGNLTNAYAVYVKGGQDAPKSDVSQKSTPKEAPKKAPKPKKEEAKTETVNRREPKAEAPKEVKLDPIINNTTPEVIDLNPIAPPNVHEPKTPETPKADEAPKETQAPTETAPTVPVTPEIIAPVPVSDSDTPQALVEDETVVLRNKFNSHHVVTNIPMLTKQQMHQAKMHKISR